MPPSTLNQTSSASNPDFETLWASFSEALPPGTSVSKYHGRGMTVQAVTELGVAVNSLDSGEREQIDRALLRTVYADWRNYRYEGLSPGNPQAILTAVSLIDHVLQASVRRREREELICRAQGAGLADGAFMVVSYNQFGRMIGPRPSGDLVLLEQVFPEHSPSVLIEAQSAAVGLFQCSSPLSELVFKTDTATLLTTLTTKHPGFGQSSYQSVLNRAYYMATK